MEDKKTGVCTRSCTSTTKLEEGKLMKYCSKHNEYFPAEIQGCYNAMDKLKPIVVMIKEENES